MSGFWGKDWTVKCPCKQMLYDGKAHPWPGLYNYNVYLAHSVWLKNIVVFTGDQLDEPTAIVEGYNSYFSFSRKRSGYSGTWLKKLNHTWIQ